MRRLAADADWDPYYGDRNTVLSFVGFGLDTDAMTALLSGSLLTDAEIAEGADGWRDLPDPFADFFPLHDEQEGVPAAPLEPSPGHGRLSAGLPIGPLREQHQALGRPAGVARDPSEGQDHRLVGAAVRRHREQAPQRGKHQSLVTLLRNVIEQDRSQQIARKRRHPPPLEPRRLARSRQADR